MGRLVPPPTPIHLDAHFKTLIPTQTLLHLHARAQLPEGQPATRRPLKMVTVIDRSGSMSSDADPPIKLGDKREKSGLSLLDLAKHIVRTMAHSLGPDDELCVMVFDSYATVIVKMGAVTGAHRTRVTQCLNQVDPQGRTNLWNAIQLAYSQFGTAGGPNDNTNDNNNTARRVVYVLTDGQPNPEPPRGSLAMLQRAKAKFQEAHPTEAYPTLYTAGFGYDVDSTLLSELAECAGGTYTFVPDSGMLATGIVNWLATTLSNCATDVRFKVELPEGVTVNPEQMAGLTMETPGWGLEVSGGHMQHGQSKDLVVTLGHPSGSLPNVTELLEGLTLTYTSDHGVPSEVGVTECTPILALGTDRERARLLLVNVLHQMVHTDRDCRTRQPRLEHTIEAVHALYRPHSGDPVLQAYIKDLEKEVSAAVRVDEDFKRWGQDYLLSLLGAHKYQECNNFKDPGVQTYGGPLSNKLRDECDDLFNSLPAPRPSNASRYGGGGGLVGACASASTYTAPTSMRSFNTCANPCFPGDSTARLADGSTKPIAELTTNDVLRTADGSLARVTCVLETRTPSGAELTRFPPVREGEPPHQTTPNHPMDANFATAAATAATATIKWAHPRDVARTHLGATTIYDADCTAVYSVLAARVTQDSPYSQDSPEEEWASTFVVNGVACVTLAHGIKNDAVATHSFYGTEAVVDALRGCEGFDEGWVVLEEGSVRRDERGWAVGFGDKEVEGGGSDKSYWGVDGVRSTSAAVTMSSHVYTVGAK